MSESPIWSGAIYPSRTKLHFLPSEPRTPERVYNVPDPRRCGLMHPGLFVWNCQRESYATVGVLTLSLFSQDTRSFEGHSIHAQRDKTALSMKPTTEVLNLRQGSAIYHFNQLEGN